MLQQSIEDSRSWISILSRRTTAIRVERIVSVSTRSTQYHGTSSDSAVRHGLQLGSDRKIDRRSVLGGTRIGFSFNVLFTAAYLVSGLPRG